MADKRYRIYDTKVLVYRKDGERLVRKYDISPRRRVSRKQAALIADTEINTFTCTKGIEYLISYYEDPVN